jgi:hypothetical protein
LTKSNSKERAENDSGYKPRFDREEACSEAISDNGKDNLGLSVPPLAGRTADPLRL